MSEKAEYLDRAGIERIFERMEELGMKKSELSRALGYSNGSYLSRLIDGSIKLNIKKLDKWASALHTSKEYLLGIIDDPNDITHLDMNDKTVLRMLHLYKNMRPRELKLWLAVGQDIVNNRNTTKKGK